MRQWLAWHCDGQAQRRQQFRERQVAALAAQGATVPDTARAFTETPLWQARASRSPAPSITRATLFRYSDKRNPGLHALVRQRQLDRPTWAPRTAADVQPLLAACERSRAGIWQAVRLLQYLHRAHGVPPNVGCITELLRLCTEVRSGYGLRWSDTLLRAVREAWLTAAVQARRTALNGRPPTPAVEAEVHVWREYRHLTYRYIIDLSTVPMPGPRRRQCDVRILTWLSTLAADASRRDWTSDTQYFVAAPTAHTTTTAEAPSSGVAAVEARDLSPPVSITDLAVGAAIRLDRLRDAAAMWYRYRAVVPLSTESAGQQALLPPPPPSLIHSLVHRCAAHGLHIEALELLAFARRIGHRPRRRDLICVLDAAAEAGRRGPATAPSSTSLSASTSASRSPSAAGTRSTTLTACMPLSVQLEIDADSSASSALAAALTSAPTFVTDATVAAGAPPPVTHDLLFCLIERAGRTRLSPHWNDVLVALLRAIAAARPYEQRAERAFSVLKEARRRNLPLTEPLLHQAMMACIAGGDVRRALTLYTHLAEQGQVLRLEAANALASLCFARGHNRTARAIFEDVAERAGALRPRDAAEHAEMLSLLVRYWAQVGNEERARQGIELIRSVPGVRPTETAYVAMMHLAAARGDVEAAMHWMRALEKDAVERRPPSSAGREAVREVEQEEQVAYPPASWSGASSPSSEGEAAGMTASTTRAPRMPSERAFRALFLALRKAGAVDTAIGLLNEYAVRYQYRPSAVVCALVVQTCLRASRIEDARRLREQMGQWGVPVPTAARSVGV